MEKSIIRTYSAGVFYGEVKEVKHEVDGVSATIQHCRRLWYWNGAASLSQLAVEGTSKPQNCKFTVTVDEMKVFGVIEIIPCTKEAQKSIESVKEWRA